VAASCLAPEATISQTSQEHSGPDGDHRQNAEIGEHGYSFSKGNSHVSSSFHIKIPSAHPVQLSAPQEKLSLLILILYLKIEVIVKVIVIEFIVVVIEEFLKEILRQHIPILIDVLKGKAIIDHRFNQIMFNRPFFDLEADVLAVLGEGCVGRVREDHHATNAENWKQSDLRKNVEDVSEDY
jgi:hypothetical protein